MPAKICGSAAGSTSRRIRSRRGTPYDRAVSISVGSIPRTPSIVFSSTGKRQKKAMKEIFCAFADRAAARTIEIGSSAGGGIARQYSMCGIASAAPQRREADRDAERDADDDRDREAERRSARGSARRSCRTARRATCCWKSTRIVDSRGNFDRVRAAPSRAATRAGSRAAPRSRAAIFSAAVRARAHAAASRCDGCQRSARALDAREHEVDREAEEADGERERVELVVEAVRLRDSSSSGRARECR